MALKALLENEEAFKTLPEIIQKEYVKQEDGTYVLDTDEKGYKQKIGEFRENYIKTRRELEAKIAEAEKYKDIDPGAFAALKEKAAKLDKLEEERLAAAGNIDEVFSKRTEEMKKKHEQEVKREREAREKADAEARRVREQFRERLLDGSVRDEVSKVGQLRKGAIDDVLNRARNVFKLNENDELVAPDKFDADGKPLTLETWSQQLIKDNPYLFEASQGGGATGGTRSTDRGASNQKVLRDPTPKEFAKNAERIAKGELEVVRSR